MEMQCAETMPEPSPFEIEQILIEDLPYVSAFSKSRNGKRDILKATLHCRHAGPQACIGTAADRSLDQAAVQLRELLEREHGGQECMAEVAAAEAAAASKRHDEITERVLVEKSGRVLCYVYFTPSGWPLC